MNAIIKGFNILISVVLFIVALGVAYVAIPYFGNQALIVRSGSMEPTIPVGSIVAVRSQDKSEQLGEIVSPIAENSKSQGINSSGKYSVGDVIAFKSEKNSKTIITHRIVAVEQGEKGILYKTKGDANEEADNWTVSEGNIIGKSFFTLPGFGKFLTFAKSDVGLPLLIIFPAAIVIFMEIANILGEFKKRKSREVTPPKREFSLMSSPLKMLIPLIIALSFVIQVAIAFPQDTENSTGNNFTAAESYATESANIR